MPLLRLLRNKKEILKIFIENLKRNRKNVNPFVKKKEFVSENFEENKKKSLENVKHVKYCCYYNLRFGN